MLEYTIISGNQKEEVISEINKLLSTGWKLHGNMCFNAQALDGNADVFYFAQALVKDVKHHHIPLSMSVTKTTKYKHLE